MSLICLRRRSDNVILSFVRTFVPLLYMFWGVFLWFFWTPWHINFISYYEGQTAETIMCPGFKKVQCLIVFRIIGHLCTMKRTTKWLLFEWMLVFISLNCKCKKWEKRVENLCGFYFPLFCLSCMKCTVKHCFDTDCFLFLSSFASLVKAGGKRVAKKGMEENATHATPEKDTRKSDKIRYAHTLQ